MTDSASKRAVLARRAKFIAAAMATSVAGCEPPPPEPRVCLNVPIDRPDADATDAPDVLDASLTTDSADATASDGTVDSSLSVNTTDAAPDVRIRPMVCLKIAPKRVDAGPPPRPCLKMAHPPDDD